MIIGNGTRGGGGKENEQTSRADSSKTKIKKSGLQKRNSADHGDVGGGRVKVE